MIDCLQVDIGGLMASGGLDTTEFLFKLRSSILVTLILIDELNDIADILCREEIGIMVQDPHA